MTAQVSLLFNRPLKTYCCQACSQRLILL
nr:DUF2197 domain-containing protein [Klebsiella variicola]